MKTEDKLRWIENKVRSAQTESRKLEPIAIIGLSGMFPRCADVREFWRALDADQVMLEEIPTNRLPRRAWSDFYDATGEDPNKSRSKIGGFLPDITSFDPHFFGIMPDDAMRMDPRQRLMLMSVYHTLEDAGIDPSSLKKSRTGVFVAGEDNEYTQLLREAGVDLGSGFGQAANMLANQISYFFDFAGPSEMVNTMCSGGAVALHRAVSALRSGEVDQVVVGAINIILRPEPFVQLSRAKQLSRSKTVRSFGEGADGHLRAEGVASVLLKPLRAAEAAGDRVYAVIKHSAVNYNGQGGMSIAAPYVRSHQEVIRACYDQANVDPRQVGYIELQGMGNPVADLAEWHACNNALRGMAEAQGVALSEGNCRVSTLKPLIGHMESASAFGALFKVIRSFQTNTVHKIVGFTKPHPELVVEQQPCRLVAETEHWPAGPVPRLAGLHSYGIGGNNVHLLVEEYRDSRRLVGGEIAGDERSERVVQPEWIILSAKTKERLPVVARQLADYFDQEGTRQSHLSDVAWTLQTGREGLRERVTFVAHSFEDLQRRLRAVAAGSMDEDLIYGSVAHRSGRSSQNWTTPEAAAQVAKLAHEWGTLGHRWANGDIIPWERLRPARSAQRLALPGYPFAKKRCWFEEDPPVQQISTKERTGKEPVPAAEPPNKLIELYDSIEERSGNEYWQDYLTFFPFLERVPGFSTTRVALHPEQYPEEMALVRAKKIELRQVLFYKERFEKLERMLDIGCGHGTDVMRTASLYANLRTDGYTITPSQAKLGNKRIAEIGLEERVRIYNRDSTRDPFPASYDLAIGIEVCCHIKDKEGLFRNLTASLHEGSRVLLMDFLTNLRGPIADPKIETYIPTREEWVKLLAGHHLVLDEVVDVSPQIANANYDDELEESIKELPVVLQDAWRNWTHNAAAIERGWVGYFIFRIVYRPSLSEEACCAQSRDRLNHPVAYPEALADMLAGGYIPYPKPETEPSQARPNQAEQKSSKAGLGIDVSRVVAQLIEIFTNRLGFERDEIAEDVPFLEMGLSSINAVEFLEYINQAFDLTLSTGLIFEYNTIEALAAHIATMLPVAEAWTEAAGKPARKPLSEGEKGLWALAHFNPASGVYNCPLCLSGQGLDEDLFAKTCQVLAQRFPILASRFVLQDGVLEQRLDTAVQVPVEKIDAVGLSEDSLVTLLREKNSQPFDLMTGPLMRALIANRGDGHQVVLFSVHHLAIDGGSVPPFLHTFIDTYRQLREGLVVSTESTGIEDYTHFVEQERLLLSSPEGARRVGYWQERLSGDLPTLNLPGDAAGDQQGGHTVSRSLSRSMHEQVIALTQELGVYPSTVFLGVFQMVLRHYSGQSDVIIGMPVNERSRNKNGEVPGFFVNMVPIRVSMASGTPIATFLRSLQSNLLDDVAHRLPFPVLVRELGIPLSNTAPIFRVAFEYQTVAIQETLAAVQVPTQDTGSSPRFAPFDGVHQEGEYDVVFEVVAGGSDTVLRIKTAKAIFSRGATERLLAHCLECLQAIASNPERGLTKIGLDEQSLVTEEERRLLQSWNDTAKPFDLETPVHKLFERQAHATPNAVALEVGGERITYAELDTLSTQVALYLRQQGVSGQGQIAICARRSRWMVIGILGIVKAGCAYVPLDPTYPAERLRYMLKDAGVNIVITESSLVSQVEALGQSLNVMPLDSRWEEIVAAPKVDPVAVNGDDLAYTIYTSGSSGQPKGVMIPHRALTNFLLSMAREPGLSAGDRLMAVTTFGFDIAGLELFLPLIQGGVCCLCSDEEVSNVEQLKLAIARSRPAIIQATPTMWTMLAHAGWRNEERVRIFCGGEPLPAALKTFFDQTGSEVWNLYGPTETTIWSTVQRLVPNASITVGRPIANTGVWVLNKKGLCAPLGVPGELCVDGVGLAEGYRNRPDLTAEVFVEHPLRPGERLYRTGDLARWLPEGEIEHLGRLDFQVKINGFRIELGEIERRMVEHPAVQDCVVVAKELDGAKQLIAYVIAAPFDAPAFRTHLAERVTPYMVPAHILAIDAFPKTANGKTDRKALAAREIQLHRNREQLLPQSELERKLMAIWQDLLQIQKLSTTDGFFEVGGSSVLAVVLADRIGQAFGVSFTAPELFKYPSVQAIAAHLAGPTKVPVIDIAPVESQLMSGKGEMPDYYTDSLAIVGISCQFANAEDHRAFWANLQSGKTSGRFLTPEELRAAGVPEGKINDPHFVPFDGRLPGRDHFDPSFFNLSSNNAELFDPQLRLLLMHAWKAVEDAGYVPKDLADTAVFMSACHSYYKTLLHQLGALEAPDEYVTWIASQGGTIPTMISYQLGFKGPSAFVHTNCSSSLSALYFAQQTLLAGEATAALVGASTLFPVPGVGYTHEAGLHYASDARCKAFDAAADGMVGGEGVAVLLVKRASDAVRDGDHIYAVVRGVGLNNDGAEKAGFYAPSVQGQAAVIDRVLKATGIHPETISYLEAHGTGTSLGDPIEVMALTDAYRRYTNKRQFCGLGSVKTNLGHLDTAAGLAGCIKLALSLQHRELPPTLHLVSPNPAIDFAASPFRLQQKGGAWEQQTGPRRAALSSFGIGGTNAHAILEEAVPRLSQVALKSPQLILLSARNEERLTDYAERLADFLEDETSSAQDLGDVAYTLQVGRVAMAQRFATVVDSIPKLIGRLRAFVSGSREGMLTGQAGAISPVLQKLGQDSDGQSLIHGWFSKGKLTEVAELWVQGLHIDWARLTAGQTSRRCSLPTYPFAEERFWPQGGSVATPHLTSSTAPPKTLLFHPTWQESTLPISSVQKGERGLPDGTEVVVVGAWKSAPGTLLPVDEKDVAESYEQVSLQLLQRVRATLQARPQRQVVLQVVVDVQYAGLAAGFAGLMRSARQECSHFRGQVIEVPSSYSQEELIACLQANVTSSEATHIRYVERRRYVRAWEAVQEPTVTAPVPWKEDGVYVITGGTGRAGIVIAREILRQAKQAQVVLASRRGGPEETLSEDLVKTARIHVRPCDVSVRDEVQALVQGVRAEFGHLNGILHAAGATRDQFLIHKDDAAFRETLGAKLRGAVYLDEASREYGLDFILFFSSLAGAFGNAGQADYALANAFMDGYVEQHRNISNGVLRSCLWPLWRNGGMAMEPGAVAAMQARTGLIPLENQQGVAALSEALASSDKTVAVFHGDAEKIRAFVEGQSESARRAAVSDSPLIAQKTLSSAQALAQIRAIVAQVMRLPVEKIEGQALLESFGLDSITVTRLNRRMRETFGDVSATLFYEYRTLADVADFLASSGVVIQSPPSQMAEPNSAAVSRPVSSSTTEPIAIIGISGRYPGSRDLEAFWEHLKAGDDLVSEIPNDRWPLTDFYQANVEEAIANGKSYAKWGSFLDNVAEFDPLFFALSPREALEMDPQERLFMQTAWEALEDAGLTRQTLQQQFHRRVGIFAGVTKTGYELYGPALRAQGEQFFPHTSFSSFANRLSYFLDVEGPSMPIDTMCSSALSAIHEACLHIRSGACEIALAGAVNLYLHPSTYTALCSRRMLSAQGRCASFGEGAQGFVPGEGVGVVVLKSLAKAEADGDQIYGVIRGSQMNHGGKTNGYTVPNPKAQAHLIREALRQADVEARAISYIEAHGTGTALGDPIEVEGLTQAFASSTRKRSFCALGSVKSNIGHLEAAAGMAGLTKVLLQMKHRTLVPSLHAKSLNPNISFEKTPFVVQRELAPWIQPTIDGHLQPRIAGISSFGAGGVNVHLIVEEYISEVVTQPDDSGEPVAIILSAQQEPRLREAAERLLHHLATRPNLRLRDVAYTLQIGREAMTTRWGVVVHSRNELLQVLRAYLEGQHGPSSAVMKGSARERKAALAAYGDEHGWHNAASRWIEEKNLSSLVSHWVRGLDVDWGALHRSGETRRLSLPTYPFGRETFWLPKRLTPSSRLVPGSIVSESSSSLAETMTLRPVWEPIYEVPSAPLSQTPLFIVRFGTSERALYREVVTGLDPATTIHLEMEASQHEILERLRPVSAGGHIILVAPEPSGAVLDSQAKSVISLYRLVKALQQLVTEGNGITLTIVTQRAVAVHSDQVVQPTHAAWHGFAGSLAKEMPGWRVRLVDIDDETDTSIDGKQLLSVDAEARLGGLATRGGRWFQQRLIPVTSARSGALPYRNGGVYVVIGGAGSLGSWWSRHMIEHYQAQLVWIGRRSLDAEIQARMDELSQFGPAPRYFSADARLPEALAQVLESIKEFAPQIHGVVHAALGAYDRRLSEMVEADFIETYSAKANVAAAIAEVFGKEPLELILFFSSLAAFGRDDGMSAYAAGCMYKDALGLSLQGRLSCPVHIVNWGYWAVGGGERISSSLRAHLDRVGIKPIDPKDGMAALNAMLADRTPQVAIVRLREPAAVPLIDPNQCFGFNPSKGRPCAEMAVQQSGKTSPPSKPAYLAVLDHWMARLLFAELRALGVLQNDVAEDVRSMRVRAGVLVKFERWWGEALTVLEEQGYVIRTGTHLHAVGTVEAEGPLWLAWAKTKERLDQDPEARTLTELIDLCFKRLRAMLRGETLVTDILFPNGSTALMEGLYRGHVIPDYFNDVLAGYVLAYIERRLAENPTARIRLVEIGAGTGGTTSTILPRLRAVQHAIADYSFTDLSKSFLLQAQGRYSRDYPYVSYKLWNIEEAAEGQGLELGSYDIAIATNVLHATSNMHRTIRNAKAVLAENGILVVNEISEKTMFASLIFGLIDGWSLAEDDAIRIPGSPGLLPEAWRNLLLAEGFKAVYFPAQHAHSLGQQIVVGESDGVTRQRRRAVKPIQPQQADILPVPQPVSSRQPVPTTLSVNTDRVASQVHHALTGALRMESGRLDPEIAFADYGVDSILGADFVGRLNAVFGLSLNTTVLFEYTTLESLTEHIADQVGSDPRWRQASEEVQSEVVAVPSAVNSAPVHQRGGIAVIGMSGQFPGADDYETFWHNLMQGVDAVGELPPRYLSREAYGPNKAPGKSYCRWGGILADKDCFDPMFFNLSPREAESMNPHQRLVMQESWKALEDAGYNPASLAGSQTGIFVGAEPTGYHHETFTGASEAIIASRLSYFLNFRGPALVVNTGCSSSGVALHLACESLRQGESSLAIAGGVFAMMGEQILVGLSQVDMLSRTGRCHTFDAAADGMVLSEGVGMLVLKPLEDAVRDNDLIYGVIRASGMNQDGASNGITAPSAQAQEALIVDVYRRFNIDPETISYVETHGTGTKLGDPIEANSLTRAFRQFTDKRHYCVLGSAKANIGHTAASAAAIGMIKVLLSMRHRSLPGLLHFKTHNPLVDLESSAFVIHRQNTAWESHPGQPLVAALSSFGHSGTNVHFVIESHQDPVKEVTGRRRSEQIVVLSARDEDRLLEMAGRLRSYINQGGAADLASIAYTLQVGREAMEERVAFVVRDHAELAERLRAFEDQGVLGARGWRGQVHSKQKQVVEPWRYPEAADGSSDNLSQCAQAWVTGMPVEWASLYPEGTPRRARLPVYPFARERYWGPKPVRVHTKRDELHPLVHRNVSTLVHQQFVSSFTGYEFFFTDHCIDGRPMMPGVGFIEMARAAFAASLENAGSTPVRLSQLVWLRPLVPGKDGCTVHVALKPSGGDGARLAIRSAEDRVHVQATIKQVHIADDEILDLALLQERIAERVFSAEQCYTAYERIGVVYGPAHRGLRSVQTARFGQRLEVLARVNLPDGIADTASDYVLHPALLDTAMQASIGLALHLSDQPEVVRPFAPFALDELTVHGNTPTTGWVWIRAVQTPTQQQHRFDLQLFDDAGRVRVSMKGLTSRPVEAGPETKTAPSSKQFSGQEHCLVDHGGVLPVAVHPTLISRETAQCGRVLSGLRQVVWPQAFKMAEHGPAIRVVVGDDEEEPTFELVSEGSGARSMHAQGKISYAPPPQVSPLDWQNIQSRSTCFLNREACDHVMQHTHGESLLSIESLVCGDGEAVAILQQPSVSDDWEGEVETSPAMLNGAILAAVILAMREDSRDRLPMPFSLKAMWFYRSIPERAVAYVKRYRGEKSRNQVETFDVTLADLNGEVLITLTELAFVFPPADQSERLLYAKPTWTPSAVETIPSNSFDAEFSPVFFVAAEADTLQEELSRRWPSARVVLLNGAGATAKLRQVLDVTKEVIAEGRRNLYPLLLLAPEEVWGSAYAGISGWFKSLRHEQPWIMAKVLRYHDQEQVMDAIAAECVREDGDVDVRYDKQGRREVLRLQEILQLSSQEMKIEAGDVVWITGGFGGIGRVLANALAARGAKVVLSGRTAAEALRVEALPNLGEAISYLSGDVADPERLQAMLHEIVETYGKLDGVVHCAGIVRDAAVKEKSAAQMAEVLRPKIAGVLALDNVLRNHPLKFFVLCSSIAGATGNPGQADYAAANAFLDAFAVERNRQVRAGVRFGRTVSIAWPLWRNGGMRMGAEMQTLMSRITGMTAMSNKEGLAALDSILGSTEDYVFVACGDTARLRTVLPTLTQARGGGNGRQAEIKATPELLNEIKANLIEIVARVQKIPAEKIRLTRDLADYGFDSIGFMALANALNDAYDLALMPTLFFETPNLEALAEHLVEHHVLRSPDLSVSHSSQPVTSGASETEVLHQVKANLVKIVAQIQKIPPEKIRLTRDLADYGFDSIGFMALANALNDAYDLALMPTLFFETPDLATLAEHLVVHQGVRGPAINHVGSDEPVTPVPPSRAVSDAEGPATLDPLTQPDGSDKTQFLTPEPIAIVGMSGRFPGSPDLDAFWRNLVENKDLITEVPAERWNWRTCYGDPLEEPGKTRAKWGGFIQDVDRFDPLFFKISPLEAERLDPQLRILLETTWAAIEDAGYAPSSLSGTRTGVFVGVTTSDYKEAWSRYDDVGDSSMLFSFALPNRISYLLNLHGPSEPIDTACSSSLVAIHRAVESLRQGSSDQALVGGVNVILRPNIAIASSESGMLSDVGRCQTFDASADGYVRSEGVGVVLLKPLRRALADHDHIYGVIRGSAENHGGKASTPTAPNPVAQQALLVDAYTRSGIDPRTVSYIEVHGTGTKLGDPIEFNGLRGAFEKLYRERGLEFPAEPHCLLGSVKTNIGHAEAAAGIAGLIKVLLMMQHRMVPGNCHLRNQNPYLETAGTPFRLARDTEVWERLRDDRGREVPRRAGVSSFGVGGTNVHVVLEEFLPPVEPESLANDPVIIVLSARNEERLRLSATNLLRSIHSSMSLASLAYTLQVGREAMAARLALVASSMTEVEIALRAYLNGQETNGLVQSGVVTRELDEEARVVDPTHTPLPSVATAWVQGAKVDWDGYYQTSNSRRKLRRLRLPTYPFARERYWLPISETEPRMPMKGEWQEARQPEDDQLLYLPGWKHCPVAAPALQTPNRVIVVAPARTGNLAEAMCEYLTKHACTTFIVTVADQTRELAPGNWLCGRDDREGLARCLAAVGTVDGFIFLSDCQALPEFEDIDWQRSGLEHETQLLRLVQTLARRQSTTSIQGYVVKLTDEVSGNPHGGGLAGLTYAIAQSSDRFAMRNLEIPIQDLTDAFTRDLVLNSLWREPASDRGEIVRLSATGRYEQVFLPWDGVLPDGLSSIRQGGVYVLIGGSGTVGRVLTRYLLSRYGARVIWVGRRPETDVAPFLDEAVRYGSRPDYLQADVTSIKQMEQVSRRVQEIYPAVHGVIFSAVTSNPENVVLHTTEEAFDAVVRVKTAGSYACYTAFRNVDLDFMCFFSSSQAFAFSGASRYAGYAAGITSADQLVRALQPQSSFPIGIINWGFWRSSLGQVVLPDHLRAMDDVEGMHYFEQLIWSLQHGQLRQSLCLRTSPEVREVMRVSNHDRVKLSEESPLGGGAKRPASWSPFLRHWDISWPSRSWW